MPLSPLMCALKLSVELGMSSSLQARHSARSVAVNKTEAFFACVALTRCVLSAWHIGPSARYCIYGDQ